jgi:hypothetical protein
LLCQVVEAGEPSEPTTFDRAKGDCLKAGRNVSTVVEKRMPGRNGTIVAP